ncbi:uncharacterized protein LOC144661475 isoform X3 [Oculina patagonica]
MASIGQCSRSAFRRVNHSSFASNSSSSFSIRSILNLPEAEKSQQCTQALDDMLASSPVWLCPPLVPRVVLPMVNCYNGHPLCKGLINQQQFGCTPQQNVWSTLAEREIPFKVGVNVFPKKRRRPMRKKKQRPLFSPNQIQTMEKEFTKQRYVTEDKRAQLASESDSTFLFNSVIHPEIE